MGWGKILGIVFALLIILLMLFYFIPFNTLNFTTQSEDSNFSIIPGENQMQFYSNMRFPNSEISYRISDCPLQKENDMEFAFDIMENLTLLTFYPVNNNEQISVMCEERNRVNGDLFIAGEGGPINITVAGDFNVISHGEILLIKESECPKPNIALHELFHVLGFEHSTNQENIMYNLTRCDQIIGEDMLQLINKLYSIPNYPDLIFRNMSATINGRFLDVNMTVLNAGLGYAEESKVVIYANGNIIKEINLESFEIGKGLIITLQNIWVSQVGVNELEFIINSNFNEINKENNKIKLEIKK